MSERTIDLSTFFLSISSAAYYALGLVKPEGVQSPIEEVDFELAEQNIALLELMREKTQSHRTKDESVILEKLIGDLKLAYLEARSKKRTKK